MTSHHHIIEAYISKVREATRDLLVDWDAAKNNDIIDRAFALSPPIPPSVPPPEVTPVAAAALVQAIDRRVEVLKAPAKGVTIPKYGYIVLRPHDRPFKAGSDRAKHWEILLRYDGEASGFVHFYAEMVAFKTPSGNGTAGAFLTKVHDMGLVLSERGPHSRGPTGTGKTSRRIIGKLDVDA